MALKQYSFKIRTLKNMQDENSPHILSNFQFLARNKEEAEKYMKTLISNYNANMPFMPSMPREVTELKESEY